MTKNAFGLSRNIPTDIKRAVRQRCGFGCIACGASIYEYDHFDPEFTEAREHRAEGIVLLCPTCHGLKDKGILTRDRIRELCNSPAALRRGSSSIVLPHFKGLPKLRLGGSVLIEQTPIPLRVNSTTVMEFLPPEEGSDIARVSAFITGSKGQGVLRIIENEWIVPNGNWDYEWVGQRMTVRESEGEGGLELFIAPPSYIGIDKLFTTFQNWEIRATATELRLGDVLLINVRIAGFDVAIQLSSVSDPTFSGDGFGVHIVEAEAGGPPIRVN